ncbi:MAG: hypothetical protein MRJ96_03495 [Nitrospirales bacterium]|nr:hypothetical protein [Nitrospira sp.]MDR4500503.1 hypothetical protein [Nitrospirales bacterium]
MAEKQINEMRYVYEIGAFLISFETLMDNIRRFLRLCYETNTHASCSKKKISELDNLTAGPLIEKLTKAYSPIAASDKEGLQALSGFQKYMEQIKEDRNQLVHGYHLKSDSPGVGFTIKKGKKAKAMSHTAEDLRSRTVFMHQLSQDLHRACSALKHKQSIKKCFVTLSNSQSATANLKPIGQNIFKENAIHR